jgi:plastocyanin
MTMAKIRLALRGAGVAVAVAMALAGASIALAADQAVDIEGFAFSPQSVTVSEGDTITWTNADNAPHTATADDGSWDTGNIAAGGGTGEVTFDTAGTFEYHCEIHPNMTGTVIVEAAGGAGATPPPTDTESPTTAEGATAGVGTAVLVVALATFVGALALGLRRFGLR